MAPELPTGFMSVEAAANKHGSILSVIGVVTDSLPPLRSRGTDYQFTFTVVDGSSQLNNDFGLKVKFFRPSPEELPPIQSNGDIIILRNIKINTWNGKTVALSNHVTEWTVLPASSIPERRPPGDVKLPYACSPGAERPSSAEYRYVMGLHYSQNGNTSARSTGCSRDYDHRVPPAKSIEHVPVQRQNLPSIPVQYSSGYNTDKRSSYGGTLIKDIKEFVFSDLVGQVVKIFPTGGEKLEFYITDYTANNHLFNYEHSGEDSVYMGRDGDEFGYALSRGFDRSWPGPYGKMTLLVILWSPHSFYAQNHVKEGDNIFLRNVKIKFNREGGTRLEGWLHTNKYNPDRVDISVIKNEEDERVRALLERKRAYWKKFNQQQQAEDLVTTKECKPGQAGQGKTVRKRQIEEVDSGPEAEEVLESRPEKKKRRRGKARARQQQRPQSENVIESGRGPSSETLEPNQYVRCMHPEVDPIPLSELYKGIRLDVKSPAGVDYRLPFQNCRCRARVRVVDFFPPNLADFAVPIDDPDADVPSDSVYSGSSRDSAEIRGPWQHVGEEVTERKWEWRFYLLVEDANPKSASTKNGEVYRLKLMVGDRPAEFLLKMTPEDLRKNPTALLQLKEKLFVLWGDLQERKSATTARILQDVSNNGNPQVDAHGAASEVGSHSSKPFECCIQEYGVRAHKPESEEDDGVDVERWERRFMMFGTTIM